MESAKLSSPHYIDAQIVNPFLNGTLRVFREMLFFEPDYGKPFLVKDSSAHRWEISGIIGMVGDGEGIVALRIPSVLAEKLLDKTGVIVENEAERPKILNGFVSELVNMISSRATADLGKYDLRLTPPFTVQGKNHRISWPAKKPIIGVPFRTVYGSFEVEVSISCRNNCE